MKIYIVSLLLIFLFIINLHSQYYPTTIKEYPDKSGLIYTGNSFSNLIQNDNINYNAIWSQGTIFPQPTRYHGSGALWVNSTHDTAKLICFGGDVDGTGNGSILTNVYNITTNSWSYGTNLSDGRFYAFACCSGDSAYFLGGINGTGGSFANEVNTVDIYNVRTNTMTLGPVLPVTMADARALPYQDSIIYIVGGLVGGTSNATPNVELFNIHTGTYRLATPMPFARSGFAGVIVGDTIYVICGGTGYSIGLTNMLLIGAINQSNRAIITWSTGVNYWGTSLHRFYAEKWGCKGFITGCGSISGFSTSTEAYIYNTHTHTWSQSINATNPAAAYFSGSVQLGTNGITKWLVVSGLRLGTPYSTNYTQIFTDSLCGIITEISNDNKKIPSAFLLYQNYPNPFNPVTKIKFDLPSNVKSKTSNVKLIVYDALGREVAILVNDKLATGTYEVEWSAGNFPNGIYFYKLSYGVYSETKRMVLIK